MLVAERHDPKVRVGDNLTRHLDVVDADVVERVLARGPILGPPGRRRGQRGERGRGRWRCRRGTFGIAASR